MSYREYFDIDPEYFPQVDKKIIEEQPDLWKKFYPHPTFIKLLKSSFGQVLYCPYDYDKVRLIVKKMTD